MKSEVNPAFVEYFRCPDDCAQIRTAEAAAENCQESPGYFRFGSEVCFGASTTARVCATVNDALADVLPHVFADGQTCVLPFNLSEVVANFRHERYVDRQPQQSLWKKVARSAYYLARPVLPVRVRRHAQKLWLRGWEQKTFPRWPVDGTVDRLFRATMGLVLRTTKKQRIPFVWFWPEGKTSCAIVTHDVEEDDGLRFCPKLMDLDDTFDIKSSFQLIPAARYSVSSRILESFQARGFEVNVHDLKHDGQLYRDHQSFQDGVSQINHHLARFGSKGFRSGVLYRNLEWYNNFDFSYDMSVPNVGHLDPQPGGCCTVTPYYVGGILELPLTTVQDYSLFHICRTYSTALWNQQIDVIHRHHGLMSFNIHPDYLNAPEAINAYKQLLATLANMRSESNVWIPRPGDVDCWWRQRSAMQIKRSGDRWVIEGEGAERARVAYASLHGDSVQYSFA